MERAKNKYTDKFEFILRINGNIICQRYFNIRGYNNKAKDSMDIRWDLGDIVDTIQSYLRKQTEEFLWLNYNPYTSKNSVVKERFTGMDFPPKVRYSVNIKSLIPSLISKIQRGLSQRKYSTVEEHYPIEISN
jgi:hypothetical protein